MFHSCLRLVLPVPQRCRVLYKSSFRATLELRRISSVGLKERRSGSEDKYFQIWEDGHPD